MLKIELDRLIVVAGPTCCGKTMFINLLRSGKLKEIETMLQMGELNSWYYQDAYYLNFKKLKEIAQLSKTKILLHFTIPLPRLLIFLRTIALLGAFDRKARLKILQSAKNLTVLTFYTSQEVLIERVRKRTRFIINHLEKNNVNLLEKMFSMYKIIITERLYSKKKTHLLLYSKWFNFLKNNLNIKTHYLIENTDKLIFFKINEMSDIYKIIPRQGSLYHLSKTKTTPHLIWPNP